MDSNRKKAINLALAEIDRNRGKYGAKENQDAMLARLIKHHQLKDTVKRPSQEAVDLQVEKYRNMMTQTIQKGGKNFKKGPYKIDQFFQKGSLMLTQDFLKKLGYRGGDVLQGQSRQTGQVMGMSSSSIPGGTRMEDFQPSSSVQYPAPSVGNSQMKIPYLLSNQAPASRSETLQQPEVEISESEDDDDDDDDDDDYTIASEEPVRPARSRKIDPNSARGQEILAGVRRGLAEIERTGQSGTKRSFEEAQGKGAMEQASRKKLKLTVAPQQPSASPSQPIQHIVPNDATAVDEQQFSAIMASSPTVVSPASPTKRKATDTGDTGPRKEPRLSAPSSKTAGVVAGPAPSNINAATDLSTADQEASAALASAASLERARNVAGEFSSPTANVDTTGVLEVAQHDGGAQRDDTNAAIAANSSSSAEASDLVEKGEAAPSNASAANKQAEAEQPNGNPRPTGWHMPKSEINPIETLFVEHMDGNALQYNLDRFKSYAEDFAYDILEGTGVEPDKPAEFVGSPSEELKALYEIIFGEKWKRQAFLISQAEFSAVDTLKALFCAALYKCAFEDELPWMGPDKAAELVKDFQPHLDFVLREYIGGRPGMLKPTFRNMLWQASKYQFENHEWEQNNIVPYAEDLADSFMLTINAQLRQLGATRVNTGENTNDFWHQRTEKMASAFKHAILIRGQMRASKYYYDHRWPRSGELRDHDLMEDTGKQTRPNRVRHAFWPTIWYKTTKGEEWKVMVKAMVAVHKKKHLPEDLVAASAGGDAAVTSARS